MVLHGGNRNQPSSKESFPISASSGDILMTMKSANASNETGSAAGLHAGLRGEEQAAELRKWPDFAGGWT